MSRIFISYSREDETFVLKLAGSLSEIGASVWLDTQDIPPGMKWSSAVQQALDDCEIMLVIISPESMASKNVEDEWQYFMDEGKQVIPVQWRPAKLHFQLRRLQYVDFHEQDFKKAVERLSAVLGITQPITPAVSPPEVKTPQRNPTAPIRETLKRKIADLNRRMLEFLPPPFEWCYVPAGSVVLENAYSTESGRFDVLGFLMAKYPITNAQYDVFVNATDGYANAAWWDYSRPVRVWRKENVRPAQTAYEGNNLPRTRVNWFDSLAFCFWLEKKSKFEIMLPTEQQWQRAAQGDDRRVYPWGNDFDASRCNTKENGIGQPTPVTQYPNGASPYDVMDISGNVWEWCLTEWGTDSTSVSRGGERVLRGGSFDYLQGNARAASRSSRAPYDRLSNAGFRICCGSGLILSVSGGL